MNSFLKRVLFFNQSRPRLSFFLSLILVSTGLAYGFFGLFHIVTSKHLLAEFEQKHKSYFYLKTAQKILKGASIDPSNYIIEEIESISLLTHLRQRHEQSLYPHLPVDLNPLENRFQHHVLNHPVKGSKTYSFELIKPVLADEEDLKQLLSLTENKSIFPFKVSSQAPYFYFKKFSIKKQPLSSCENAYQISYILESISL
jgi:hypothetical protein